MSIKQGGKDVQIDFPESPDEVTLSAFIDYEKAMEALRKWREENDSKNFNSFAYRASELKHIIACIVAFCGQDISETPFNKFRFSRKDGIDDGVEASLFAAFHLCGVCMTAYQKTDYTDDYWFAYKGQRYNIPGAYVDEITKQQRFEDVTTAQAVEALEAWRMFETVQAEDPDGGYLFKTMLNIIACFARCEKDDPFPTSESEIQRHLSERIVFFKDISMQAGLDVYNFFFGTTHPFAPIRVMPGFSNRQNEPEKQKSSASL